MINTEEKSYTFKSYIDAPKWARVPSFLREACFKHDFECKIEEENGWIRQRVYFTIVFPSRGVAIPFLETILKILEESNE